MKKILFSIMAVAAVFATSCVKGLEDNQTAGQETTVTFSVATPEIATRAFSDGTSATALQYAVYNADGEILNDFTKTDATINGSASVKLQLVSGKTYSVIFWAAAPNAPYTVDLSSKRVTVDYTDAKSNDEARDAFYACHTFTVSGAQTETVTLKRPFAQLNVGAADFAAAASSQYVPTKSSVKVKDVYSTLDLETGAVDGETDVVFAENAIPSADETFPVAGNKYVAMNYVLVGADKVLVDVEFTFTDGTLAKTRTVGSVPVQRNYRTNIYGNILTDDVDVNVNIQPDYETPDYTIYNVVVDGVSYDDFATAVAKAVELGKPIEFVQNVQIDADNTITVAEGETLTLNLNGYTLAGVTDDADKNDDGKITSADNEVMFDVRGKINVNNGNVTIIHTGKGYADFAWNASGEAFYVGFNGELNVEDARIENLGGLPMAYAIDLVNAAANGTGLRLDVVNSTLKSSYIPVRVFNNGSGMNDVTIKNSTLEGTSRAFWVHIYTNADNGNKGVKDSTLKIDIYNNGNTFIAGKPLRAIEYGFTEPFNVLPDGTFVTLNADMDKVQEVVGGGNTAMVSNLSEMKAAINAGKNTVLSADVDYGTTQIALNGVEVNLNGHTLTTQMSFGGMALKDGASIRNGVIEHTSTVAAIKAFNVGAIEDVTIRTTCATADKTITAIAVQQGGHVGTIRNVTIEGVSQGIEVGYQASVDLIENVTADMTTNGTENGIGMIINGGKVGKAVSSTFIGEVYGIWMHFKGVYDVALCLESCNVEGATASIYAWDEKGISNTSGTFTLSYDSATTLVGPTVFDFEEECKEVVKIN